MDVELSDDNKTYHTVNILNTYKIIPGHTYELIQLKIYLNIHIYTM